MESLFLIAPIAIIFCAIAIAAWLWATQNGQYDDLDREARRILENDPNEPLTHTKTGTKNDDNQS